MYGYQESMFVSGPSWYIFFVTEAELHEICFGEAKSFNEKLYSTWARMLVRVMCRLLYNTFV